MYEVVKKLILLLLFLVISCSKTIAPENNKSIYSYGFDTNTITFVNIYEGTSKIYILANYGDKKINLIGDLNNVKLKNKLDGRIFANRIIKLNLIKNKDTENISIINNKTNLKKINIIKYEQWSKIIIPILEKVILEIVPKTKDEGVMVSIANKDVAIYYDNNKMVKLEKIEHVKNNIRIIKSYTEKEFYEKIEAQIKKTPEIINKTVNGLIVFELNNDADTESPYVLFNIDSQQLYYFDFSSIVKLKYGTSNLNYYVQILFNAVVKAHIIEPVKNPVTTIQKGSTFSYQLVRKTFENKTISKAEEIKPLSTNGEMMDIEKFENELDRIVGKKRYKGSLEFLIGGPAFFNDFLNTIESSKNEIFIRLYIYSNDDYGVRISDILKNKSNSGVDIRILTGALSNNAESMKRSAIPFDKDFKQPKSIFQYLAYKSNVNVRTSADTFFMFDHSKMIIVDKKIAYVGGMNIGQPYRYTWHDMMVKLRGPIVYEIKNQFNQAWAAAGPTGDIGKFITFLSNKSSIPKDLQEFYNIDSDKHAEIRVLYTKPQNKQIYKSQMHAIKNAKKFIYIENPYLADYRIINALIDARRRGVDIRIILPSENNVGMMGASNLVITNIFLKNGIRVFKYQGMTHIKAAIYDGWATLGSANFDNLSLMINDEFNIAFSNPYYVEKLKKELFDVDFKLSIEVKEPYVINWYDKVMSSFANRF